MKLISLTLASLVLLNATAADWTHFRGPHGNGISDETTLSSKLDQSNVAWKSALPGRGLSSPLIIGDRVFVTCSSGAKQDRLHVICLSAKDGTKLWERQFWATGRTLVHPKIGVAAPTPASDGRRIYAIFSSNDLVCLDLEGNLIWLRGLTRDYPKSSNSLGLSSSLLVVGDVVVAMSENEGDSFTAGLDAATGVNRWKISRPKSANWTSPVVIPGAGGRNLVAIQSEKGLTAIDPASGKIAWANTNGASTIPSSAFLRDVLYVPGGGITAWKLDAANPPTQLWKVAQLAAGTASPVALGERLFTINNAAVLTCADVADGKRLWQLRLQGPFSATPVAAGNTLYCVSEKGVLQTVDTTKPEGEIVSTLDLKETILATPSIANGALYLRSDATLWKLKSSTPAALPVP
jgi:outer membrane protein assembly factor BamB